MPLRVRYCTTDAALGQSTPLAAGTVVSTFAGSCALCLRKYGVWMTPTYPIDGLMFSLMLPVLHDQ